MLDKSAANWSRILPCGVVDRLIHRRHLHTTLHGSCRLLDSEVERCHSAACLGIDWRTGVTVDVEHSTGILVDQPPSLSQLADDTAQIGGILRGPELDPVLQPRDAAAPLQRLPS